MRAYILYNFFFYKEILLEFLQRCLVSERISQSLGRTSTLKSVELFYLDIITLLSKDFTIRVLREGESNLQHLPRQSLLHLDFTYDYLPLFSYIEAAQSEKVKQQFEDLLARFESSEFNCRHITASSKDYLIPELSNIFNDLAKIQKSRMPVIEANSKKDSHDSAPLDFIHNVKDYCARYFSKSFSHETTIFDKNLYLTIDQYEKINCHMTNCFWPSVCQTGELSHSDHTLTTSNTSQSLSLPTKRSCSELHSSVSSYISESKDCSDNFSKRSKVPGAWIEFRSTLNS